MLGETSLACLSTYGRSRTPRRPGPHLSAPVILQVLPAQKKIRPPYLLGWWGWPCLGFRNTRWHLGHLWMGMVSDRPVKSRDILHLTNEQMRGNIIGPESHKAGGTQRGARALQPGPWDFGIREVGSCGQWDVHPTYRDSGPEHRVVALSAEGHPCGARPWSPGS